MYRRCIQSIFLLKTENICCYFHLSFFQNMLNNFSRSDTLTVVARVFLLFQMMTVFPLLAYILRTQLLYAFFNSIYPSFSHVFSLNVALLTVCVIFAIFLPQVGTITRYYYESIKFTISSCHLIVLLFLN